MKIELDVIVPEGYEATGEYRTPNKGEHFIDAGHVGMAYIDFSCDYRYIILRPKKRKVVRFEADPNGNYCRVAGSFTFEKCELQSCTRERYQVVETEE